MNNVETFVSIDEFTKTYKQKQNQILYHVIPGDIETPISALIKLQGSTKYCSLYESIEGGKNRSRYSIIVTEPDLIWQCHQHKVSLKQVDDNDKESDVNVKSEAHSKPLEHLQNIIKKSYINIQAIDSNLPPMVAGLFGYMGYDMVKLMENIPDNNKDITQIPDSIFIRPRIIVIFDSVKGNIIISAPVYYNNDIEDNNKIQQLYNSSTKRIRSIVDRLSGVIDSKYYCYKNYRSETYSDQPTSADNEIKFTPNMSKEYFCNMVTKSKEYIKNGDIFQILPSQRFSTNFNFSDIALYRSLRTINPSPFLFYLKFPDFSIVGSSPEILVRVQNSIVTVRPLAGTRKRGKNRQEDLEIAKELLADEKELAEHLMLIDLGRNDVGRVAKKGSVKVTKKMEIEYYSHILHISSTVEGEMDYDKYSCMDALISGFPAGTVSGAPKIRAMEIIEELETERRSFYSGMIGYFSADNKSMDTAITLRTGLIKDNKLYVQAGAGIVMDSVEEKEYEETINKASALFKAAENAKNFQV